jgi:hypothetical protein
VSLCPQPHAPGDVFAESEGQPSEQSGTPSPSLSVSGCPQPQLPGDVLFGSFGHASTQFAVPSPSLSVSGCPHPQLPGAVLLGSLGHPSHALMVPSWSLSRSHSSGTPLELQSRLLPEAMSWASSVWLLLQSLQSSLMEFWSLNQPPETSAPGFPQKVDPYTFGTLDPSVARALPDGAVFWRKSQVMKNPGELLQ